MEKYICVHGHFYQPPRESPWLEAIELQDSAHPYHDWNERIMVWRLLELQRNAMLMYTSCGWFCDDLSGIKTVQVIQYAGRTLQLGKRLFRDGQRKILDATLADAEAASQWLKRFRSLCERISVRVAA
jgi:alpha-amylase/alpha-mannosidase (GH57 family)